MPEIATMESKIRLVCTSLQMALDGGVNGFALELIAEGLGDKDALVDSGIMFNFTRDHKKRPVWIIVTAQAPYCSVKENVSRSDAVGDVLQAARAFCKVDSSAIPDGILVFGAKEDLRRAVDRLERYDLRLEKDDSESGEEAWRTRATG